MKTLEIILKNLSSFETFKVRWIGCYYFDEKLLHITTEIYKLYALVLSKQKQGNI